jgi:hypothetical protein
VFQIFPKIREIHTKQHFFLFSGITGGEYYLDKTKFETLYPLIGSLFFDPGFCPISIN